MKIKQFFFCENFSRKSIDRYPILKKFSIDLKENSDANRETSNNLMRAVEMFCVFYFLSSEIDDQLHHLAYPRIFFEDYFREKMREARESRKEVFRFRALVFVWSLRNFDVIFFQVVCLSLSLAHLSPFLFHFSKSQISQSFHSLNFALICVVLIANFIQNISLSLPIAPPTTISQTHKEKKNLEWNF